MRISKNLLERLLEYKNALARLQAQGFSKVYSYYLAESVGVSSVQIRKDFSSCRLKGNKKGGYFISLLQKSINELLEKHEPEDIILVGAGNLGSALTKYTGFEKEGFRIIAAFDIDPAKCSRKKRFPVYPLGEMDAFIRSNSVTMGIIAVPDNEAQQVLDTMAAAGIKGVLNFAPCWLRHVREAVCVHNVNLAQELEKLNYCVRKGVGEGKRQPRPATAAARTKNEQSLNKQNNKQ